MDNYLNQQEVASRTTGNGGILTRTFSSQQYVWFHGKRGLRPLVSNTPAEQPTLRSNRWISLAVYHPKRLIFLWNHVVSQKMWVYCHCPKSVNVCAMFFPEAWLFCKYLPSYFHSGSFPSTVASRLLTSLKLFRVLLVPNRIQKTPKRVSVPSKIIHASVSPTFPASSQLSNSLG